jgi:HAD superfamily hydrolase (TIGR01450 family)
VSDSILSRVRGFVFDLDGCVWNGNTLNPGARETLAALDRAGRGLAFVSNNSRATGDELRKKLDGLGVDGARHVLTPLEIIGDVIRERYGPSRVLVIGSPDMETVIVRAGHEVVPVKEYRPATFFAVGNDFDLSYERVTNAARAAARGAPLITPNIDPRLPIEGGDFLPGSGATVAAIATAAGVRPVVVGKPEPPLFRIALERLGLPAAAAAMVGDSVPSDIRGARAVGMVTVLYAPEDVRAASRRGAGAPPAEARLWIDDGAPAGEADLVVGSFAELASLAEVF